MNRILVTDGMDKAAMETLRQAGFEVIEQFYEPDALGAALRDVDAVIIRSATKIKQPQIDAARGGRLKLIIRAGRLPQHALRLFQRRGRAGHRPALLLRPVYFRGRPHHAGGKVGEEGLFQGL